MKDQHAAISGYRDLSQAEIDLMNEIKALGPQIEAVCAKVQAHLIAQREACATFDGEDALPKFAEQLRLDRADPQRWLNWGRDSMQANLMYLTRAVAQPTSF